MTTKENKKENEQTKTVNTTGLSTRGRQFVGVVTSAKAAKTVTVVWETRKYIPKYQRYEKNYSKVHAHNPESINAKEGDKVRIMETKPLSKHKQFIFVEVLTE